MATLEEEVVSILKQNNVVMSTAESCTGGMIASSIVNVPGASSVLHQGYVTYSDLAKHRMLGVKKHTLKKYKAVSANTAREMAIGCRKKAKADLGVSVTGVAGPDTEDGKPVGLVYIGCVYQKHIIVKECHLEGDRSKIRKEATKRALLLVKSMVLHA